MKKRILAMMMTAILALSLTACGGSSEEAGATADKKDFKVGLVTDVGGVEDQSFNQSAWEGLQKAAEDFGVEVNYLSSSTDALPLINTLLSTINVSLFFS